jgi:tRNA-splicing ligase RtcB
MPVRKTIEAGRVPVHVWTDDVERAALQQLVNVARLPFVFRHVAAMPDVHTGIGATVGSIIPTKGAIIPAAVGVDIGCGMGAVRLSLSAADLPDKLGRVRGKDAGVIDEIPGACKPIDEVTANQTDLVEVVHTLKQVVCVKG